MNEIIEANKVMSFFAEIEKIPRGSGNEQAVSDYLVAFAKARGLSVTQDEALNVIIRKPASAGYETHPTVILQGHMDMVCEKSPTSTHDFETEGIELVTKGEWLYANETTLGADNGIAVAMALAILDDTTLEHGPIEALFTTSEETGMNGAHALDGSQLSGQYLLNIDTEVEGEFIVSCAGGCHVSIDIPLLRHKCEPEYTKGLKISVEGLLGGHSGIEIHKQRANANQLLARFLYDLTKTYKYDLASFKGGTKHNAITRQAEAILAVREADVEALKEEALKKAQIFAAEFTPQDSDITIVVTEIEAPDQVFAAVTTTALISFLYLAPHGVVGMSKRLDNLVETSLNLAVVKEEDRYVHMVISLRSLSKEPLNYLKHRLLLLAKTLGIKASISGGYPAWEYEPSSSLETQAIALYKEMTGQNPTVTAIHAGLECGLLKAQLPTTQMISFGPTIENAHTPQERLHLPSVERIYHYLLQLLKVLK